MLPLIDCHTHSLHSFDGEAKVFDLCRRAEELGLWAYALTDHCDLTDHSGEELFDDIAASVRELRTYREMGEKSTVFLTGIELGQAVDNFPVAEKALSLCDYDFVIGSVHNAGGIEDFYFEDYSKLTLAQIDELMEDYFDRLLALIRWGKADTLAHITYPFRYMIGEYRVPVSAARYAEQFDRVLKEVIASGMALEVNSSGLRQKIGVPLPDKELLTRYFALGGRRITVGSDAHKVADLGAGVEETVKLLSEIGFASVCYFKGRHPVEVPLGE